MSLQVPSEYRRKDYVYQSRKWRQVRDVLEGDIALKDHDYAIINNGSSTACDPYHSLCSPAVVGGYLRHINSTDKSLKNKDRNAQYIKCAVFMNATKNTRRGMSGLVFRQKPIIELPSDIAYLADDVDGNGLQLWQQMKSVTNNLISVGRHGLFVDFPTTSEATTVRESNAGQRSYITEYKAEQIINWRTKKIGAIEVLSMVVLIEIGDVETDDFQTHSTETRRVLRLVDGLYEMEVRTTAADKKQETIEVFKPLDGSGNRMNFIPFVFCGSENNNHNIDDAPMYDISVLNVGHYRNSADVEENSYFASQLTVTATGLTQQWIDDVWKGSAEIGSRAVLTGNQGASFGSIQATESDLAKSLMGDKEQQMARLGAKFIEPNSSNKTATQSQIDSADSTSSLATIAGNVNDAYIQAITWVQIFMRSASKFQIEVNTKFGVDTLTAQDLTALFGTFQSGGMSLDSFLWNLKKGHRLPEDVSVEDEKARIMADELALGVDESSNEEQGEDENEDDE